MFSYSCVSKHVSVKGCKSLKTLSSILDYVKQSRAYSKKTEQDSCCKPIDQAEGRQVEQWPRQPATCHGWRPECPVAPDPPSYDPYKIRVPEVAVPPLPETNVKEIPNEEGGLFKTTEVKFGNESVIREIFQKSTFLHPDNWKEQTPRKIQYHNVNSSRLGHHGKSKYDYAFIEPWKPLDRVTLLAKAEQEEAEMMEHKSVIIKEKSN